MTSIRTDVTGQWEMLLFTGASSEILLQMGVRKLKLTTHSVWFSIFYLCRAHHFIGISCSINSMAIFQLVKGEQWIKVVIMLREDGNKQTWVWSAPE